MTISRQVTQLPLPDARAAYKSGLIEYSMIYTWENVRIFHVHVHRARMATVYSPDRWNSPNTDKEFS